MIKAYVSDIAMQMGTKLSKISLTDGKPLGCRDVCLLHISSQESLVSTLIFQADISRMENGESSDRLEVRIRSAISRLQLILEC